jgi:hypothetical protein
MLTGLDILIARMKEHPEEFRPNGRWTDLLVTVDKHLTEEERQALKQGYRDMARDAFNEAVLKVVANEGVDAHTAYSIIDLDYDSVMAYPLRKKAMEEESHQQQMARHVEMLKMEMAQQQAEMAARDPYYNAAARQQIGLGQRLGQSISGGLFNKK